MNLGILMVQGLVNRFGTIVMAAFAAGVKIDSFAYMPAQEYGNAFSTFIAQNAGAGEKERIRKGIRCGLATSVSYCLSVSLVLFCLAKPLMLIFVDAYEAEIIAAGVRYLHTIAPFYCGIGCLFCFTGCTEARRAGNVGGADSDLIGDPRGLILHAFTDSGGRRHGDLVVGSYRLGTG